MQTVAIEGKIRQSLGKKATKALRKADEVPCVIYGGAENVHFSANTKAFRDVIYTNEFKYAKITVEGKEHVAIVKDIQFHPVTDQILHLDFVELVKDKPVIAKIPVRLTGNAPGVKVGGKLALVLRKLAVKTTPDKLRDAIMVDVSDLELGRSKRVRDIPAIEGVQILNSPGIPVAKIEIPRALRSVMQEAAKNKE